MLCLFGNAYFGKKKGIWKINEEKIVPHKNAMHIEA
jgi:hypothetical protein